MSICTPTPTPTHHHSSNKIASLQMVSLPELVFSLLQVVSAPWKKKWPSPQQSRQRSYSSLLLRVLLPLLLLPLRQLCQQL